MIKFVAVNTINFISFLTYLVISTSFPEIEKLNETDTTLDVRNIYNFKSIKFERSFCNILFCRQPNSNLRNGTDEKLSDLYFYVGEYDEDPIYHPYRIKNLYHTVISNPDTLNNTLKLAFGQSPNRQSLTLKIYSDKISF